MRCLLVVLVVVAISTGCPYRMGYGGAPDGTLTGPIVVRAEVENLTNVPGLARRFLSVLAQEAELFPGVRLAAGAERTLRVTLKRAARQAGAVDDLGRPVEETMVIEAVVSCDGLVEGAELSSPELASAIHRARRSRDADEARDAALRSIARAALSLLIDKGAEHASR